MFGTPESEHLFISRVCTGLREDDNMRRVHIEPSSSNYMAQARECVAQAEVAHNARERVSLLEMAEAWAHLAEQAEEIGHLVDDARERGLLPHKSDMH